jgi:6-pyruvoyltetrahydropterin/6-carboxytetrahydropterin synthase
VRVAGTRLNEHGFLLDIVDMRKTLNEVSEYFQGRVLNEIPEFSGLNPSVEHFCRIFAEKFASAAKLPGLERLEVLIWEDRIAQASYSREI